MKMNLHRLQGVAGTQGNLRYSLLTEQGIDGDMVAFLTVRSLLIALGTPAVQEWFPAGWKQHLFSSSMFV